MKKRNRRLLTALATAAVCAAALFLTRSPGSGNATAGKPLTDALRDSISSIASSCPGELGVALIIDNRDTVTVNNANVYPMMSVFKVHQALAICNEFDNRGLSLDSVMTLRRDDLDPLTWSPMIKEHTDSVFSLTVGDLLGYSLIQSDNNASNVMFRTLVSAEATDRYIATVIPRQAFRIAWTEEEMSASHDRAYANSTSPLGAAMLINRLFTDSLVSDAKQSFITYSLKQCMTGTDRIVAPLLGADGVTVAHKTGSGYIGADGVLAAHNDVAYVCLPNGISYSLAVFVKDFKGNEAQASQYIARVSETVYRQLSRDM